MRRLLRDCGSLNPLDVNRIRHLIARRVEIDKSLSKTTTLAENLARVLHQMRPERFPPSVLNPRTNHLENPDAFL